MSSTADPRGLISGIQPRRLGARSRRPDAPRADRSTSPIKSLATARSISRWVLSSLGMGPS